MVWEKLQVRNPRCRGVIRFSTFAVEQLRESVEQLERSQSPPALPTYASLLQECGNVRALAEGKRVHSHIIENGCDGNTFLGNLIVQMYGKCGCVEDARAAFERILPQNVFSWTIMLAAYAQNGHVHDARYMFDRMPEKNVVSWTAMITGHAQYGHRREALELFRVMDLEGEKPDQITFLSIFDACASLPVLAEGRIVHVSIIDTSYETDIKVGNALINMYGKCKCPIEAKSVFDKMPERNFVTWTGMITAYAENGYGKEALEVYQRMDAEGVKPDAVTFISILQACASFSALGKGKAIHVSVTECGLQRDLRIGNALLNMYAKCGCLEDARSIFDDMPCPDVIAWTSMIAGYAQNGHAEEALNVFQLMDMEGVKPNIITFVSILSACSHGGLLEDGCQYFASMCGDHGMTATVDHYLCMVDLLGRAGKLVEAEDLIETMPFEPDVVAWTTLAGACRIHGDPGRGARAAERVFEMKPQKVGPYVLLSNMYAAKGDWVGLAKVRKLMEERGVKKQFGTSCIEVKHRLHEFKVGDRSHPQLHEILAELERLSGLLKNAGYEPDTKAILHDIEEVEKENLLCHHSEKLAIAFGLISTRAGATLRVVNSLRVCFDCHAAIKVISKIVGRKIIVRDSSRFHHFEHGVCSCRDYW